MTRNEMAYNESTRDPVFLLQYKTRFRSKDWNTVTVFMSREEAEKFGLEHKYRWEHWRVYCVAASGELATLLRSLDPDEHRMQGRIFD